MGKSLVNAGGRVYRIDCSLFEIVIRIRSMKLSYYVTNSEVYQPVIVLPKRDPDLQNLFGGN